ncbi:toxin-antitoxin system HicB family antitoxin [Phenylobacterium sp.]|uniref:toxin-antitoxin system HicB family antitoxin n=1 Tax=Phenylobacterium sp. TaxID=1871053 RepID=UPI0025CE38F8|nr:toxin-antitoxin system HicB family antitoxin [Phenylobacterium sp.]MCA6286365.1 toxin-antitoxin system HicB family antitoxin [Phenylobacterium sp.]MCA6288348.1 toxin-antitoxin system HicB family antitoxin [Phenylobacterium sp.]MCA6310391.1 toxin-antitoxin system HicB family antitoxin [Phenylobacterium sp.]MCA6323334.1 toxin-antitoxin system HicB family antitoxin [Phenylobacterium sp.]MCA6337161.1 toxin-antitoxin system HicB family antitoxin [Phenylobacterium sp.]
MSKTSYPLKLPQSIKAAAARLAKEDGVSLNQWIAVAVAEKVGVTETAAEFLQRKAEGAQPSDLLVFLDRAADEAPSPEDEF